MPGRKVFLANDEYYHIYNRGVENRNIFIQLRDYQRFTQTLFYYQFFCPKPKFSMAMKSEIRIFKPLSSKKYVKILCYCLMPNHFHLLIKQLLDGGISIFLSQLQNSYTKYFNTKYKRFGALFQGVFKAVRIENDNQLIHTSRYIHINPVVSGIATSLKSYEFSSYFEYINNKEIICSTKEILSFFKNSVDYKQFLEDQIDYGKSLELIKHLSFDENL